MKQRWKVEWNFCFIIQHFPLFNDSKDYIKKAMFPLTLNRKSFLFELILLSTRAFICVLGLVKDAVGMLKVIVWLDFNLNGNEDAGIKLSIFSKFLFYWQFEWCTLFLCSRIFH